MEISSFPKGAVFFKNPHMPGMALGRGEFFIRCPYHLDHYALNTKFMSHLEKCRKNHIISYDQRKMSLNFLSCKYNWRHQILAPELPYHEHSCEDKTSRGLASYLYSTMTNEIDLLFENISVEDFPVGDEVKEPGLHAVAKNLHKLVNSSTLDDKYYKDVVWADPKILEKSKSNRRSMHLHLSQLSDLTFTKRKSIVRRRVKTPFKADEEEDWSNDADNTRPKFDWMYNQVVLRDQISMSYPAGFTKSQKKEFLKLNEERWRTHHGIENVQYRGGQSSASETDKSHGDA